MLAFLPLSIWLQTLAPISPLLGAAADVLVKGLRVEAVGNVQT